MRPRICRSGAALPEQVKRVTIMAQIPPPSTALPSKVAKAKRVKSDGAAAAAAAPSLSVKQLAVKRNKAREDSLKMRKRLWPTVGDDELWLREDRTRKGFTTLPRTMPMLMNLIGDASKQVAKQSVPAGQAYLVLWCRVFDEGYVSIDSEAMAALEAGYSGERNVSTWRQHLKALKELGFIDYKPGAVSPCQHVLLFNPYRVLLALKKKGWVQEAAFNAIYQRALEVGAGDLDEFEASCA
jgi:hypothetical protein